MTRTPRIPPLSVAAIAALATGGMVSMHATRTTQRSTSGADMGGMHAAMMADPAVHDSMLDNPTMQAHMGECGVDADQMRRWHDQGRPVDEIHEMLAEQGIDLDAMQADCPMLTDGSMASLHGNGGRHPSGHHRTPGR